MTSSPPSQSTAQPKTPHPIEIWVDADACPVKEEIFKVARRCMIGAIFVSNAPLRIPREPLFRRVLVSQDFDAADDYIAEHIHERAIVITADILLAERGLKSGAHVIGPTGKSFSDDMIGGAIATRAIMADLRAGVGQENIGGPAPFRPQDRSRFLSELDRVITKLKRQT